MTQLAKLFPRHPGPTILGLNFDGWSGQIPDEYVGDGKVHHIAPFAFAEDRDREIQDILFRTSEIFAPFDVQVRRVSGDGVHWGSHGHTTVFIGADGANQFEKWPGLKYKDAFTPNKYTDYPMGSSAAPNTHDYDLAFVDPYFFGPVTTASGKVVNEETRNSNAQIVRSIAHEAGHTFGLAHVRTDDVPNTYVLASDPLALGPGTVGDLMSYSTRSREFSVSKDFFANQTFNITDWNYHADEQMNELDTDLHPRWGIPGLYDIIDTQNSFTYLQAALGARPSDDFANVAHTTNFVDSSKTFHHSATDLSYADMMTKMLSPWSLTTGSIDRWGDYDVFTFVAPAGVSSLPLTVRAQASPGSKLDPMLLIYDMDPDSQDWFAFSNDISPTDHNSEIRLPALVAGHTYKIVVGGADNVRAGAYQLQTFLGYLPPGGAAQDQWRSWGAQRHQA
jgi:hypothetical protein